MEGLIFGILRYTMLSLKFDTVTALMRRVSIKCKIGI